MKVAVWLALLLASATGAEIELRPLRKLTQLPMGSCEVEVVFRLSVRDGGKEDYYCPRVVWEREDGTLSEEESGCPPIDQATPADHRRSWTRSRLFQHKGTYAVKAHLCKSRRHIRTAVTTAVVAGWDGYPAARRQEAGCSPARPPAIPIVTQVVTPPGSPQSGMLGSGDTQTPLEGDGLSRQPAPVRNPCG